MLFICFVIATQSCRIIDIFTYIPDKREMDSLIERMTPRGKNIIHIWTMLLLSVLTLFPTTATRCQTGVCLIHKTNGTKRNEQKKEKIIVKFNLFIRLSFRIFSTVFFRRETIWFISADWHREISHSFCLCVLCVLLICVRFVFIYIILFAHHLNTLFALVSVAFFSRSVLSASVFIRLYQKFILIFSAVILCLYFYFVR